MKGIYICEWKGIYLNTNDLFQQYLYVHRVLLAYFLEKYKKRFQHCLDNGGEEKYQKWCADYKRITGCD